VQHLVEQETTDAAPARRGDENLRLPVRRTLTVKVKTGEGVDAGTKGLQTPCWREPDSNPWSPRAWG
jgi:hypothetical protein